MIRSVVIVGGGLAGVATAYALVKRGIAVDLIEARDGIALDTSFANGGILTPSMPDPWNGPGVWRHFLKSLVNPDSSLLLRPSAIPGLMVWGAQFLANSRPGPFAYATRSNFLLCEYSTRRTQAWRDAERLQFDSEDKPTIKFFRSAEAMEGPLAVARSLAELGLRFDVLDGPATVALEPALTPIGDRIAGAIAYPDDVRGDAHLFTQALAARVEAMGARVRLNTSVTGLFREQGRIAGVETADGERLSADAVIVCAANATRRLIGLYGLDLPVRPAKGYSITVDLGGINGGPDHPVVDDGMHAAVVPLGQRLRVAGTAEFTGENRDLDPRRIDNLRGLLSEVYPAIADRLDGAAVRAWAGLRPMSADGRPFIGETRVPGLWINVGHGHLGWTMAAGSGELVAALVQGDAPPIDPTPYAATRI